MRFAEPARRKFGNVHHTKPRVGVGELIENSPSRIVRTVVHGNDFQVWVVNFHERGESRGKFLFLIARREKHRNARALRIECRSEILQPRKPEGAIGHADSMSEPEKCDEAKYEKSAKVHENWFQ